MAAAQKISLFQTPQAALLEKISEAAIVGSKDELAAYTHEWLRNRALREVKRQQGSTRAMVQTWIERATGVDLSGGNRIFTTEGMAAAHPHAALRKNS